MNVSGCHFPLGRNADSSPAPSGRAGLTCSRVGDGWCRHGDGNANPAAAAVLPAAAPPAAATERGTEAASERGVAVAP